jgi:hypothetical protein
MPPDLAERARQHVVEESERKRRFGRVRAPITTAHKGHRFVAVGSRLYFDQRWRTFTDFLFFYIWDVMGQEWSKTEVAKSSMRHPIVEWHDHVTDTTKKLTRDEDGLYAVDPDGITSAYLLLAYDLYVLRDHSKLQEEVVQRLRHRDQFHGARYELFVAATFIRAGFEFDYEDETDTKRKHAEFIATYRGTGLVIAVEAKARQRTIRLPFDVASIRPGVKQLLVSAADKQPSHPLVVFVELNLPPENADRVPSWVPHVNEVLQEIAAERDQRSPFAAVFFTNRPHVYGVAGEPDPSKHVLGVWPDSSPVPEAIIDILGEAARQYGNVPSKFPADFPSSSSPT